MAIKSTETDKERFFSLTARFIVSTETPTLAEEIDKHTAGPHQKINLQNKKLVFLQAHQLNAALNSNLSFFADAIHAIPKITKAKRQLLHIKQTAAEALQEDAKVYKKMKASINESNGGHKEELQENLYKFRNAAEEKQQIAANNTSELLEQADKLLTKIDEKTMQSMQEWQTEYQQSSEELITATENAVGVNLTEGEKTNVSHPTEKYKLIQEAKELGISVEAGDTELQIKAKRAIHAALSRDQAVNTNDPRIKQAMNALQNFSQEKQAELNKLETKQAARFKQEVLDPLNSLKTNSNNIEKEFTNSVLNTETSYKQFNQTVQGQRAQMSQGPSAREAPEHHN
jgi:hypothetical protein